MFRIDEGENLRDHISQFIALLNYLNNVEVNIYYEDQDMILLYSLPPSYKTFREILIYGKDKLLYEDMKCNITFLNGAENSSFGTTISM
ncbi:hypothetical protein Gotur_008179, partial [Gossypium turneri]